MEPRGIRNFNPGNIRRGDNWQGLSPIQTDESFCQFTSAEWGIRAIAVILNNYQKRDLNTVRKIISTWAPPNENDTEAYVKAVSTDCGIAPDFPIQPKDILHIIEGIIFHENGKQPYAEATILAAIDMAKPKV